jgi:hypothetical protein
MGTTKRDNSKNVDDLSKYGSYFKKYNKIDESFYNKFKELYNELLASKKILNELLYNYKKILNDTDFEHMIIFISFSSPSLLRICTHKSIFVL